MSEVTIRDLRNHGGDIVERVGRGEHVTITRAGKPVAELGPVRRVPLTAETLSDRWRRLPPVDPERLRTDIDATLDSRL